MADSRADGWRFRSRLRVGKLGIRGRLRGRLRVDVGAAGEI